jgi:hypothetical protein
MMYHELVCIFYKLCIFSMKKQARCLISVLCLRLPPAIWFPGKRQCFGGHMCAATVPVYCLLTLQCCMHAVTSSNQGPDKDSVVMSMNGGRGECLNRLCGLSLSLRWVRVLPLLTTSFQFGQVACEGAEGAISIQGCFGCNDKQTLKKNNEKQSIRAVSRQTIVPNIRRDTMSSWPVLFLQCRTAGRLTFFGGSCL